MTTRTRKLGILRPAKEMAVGALLFPNGSKIAVGRVHKLGEPVSADLDLISCDTKSLVDEIHGQAKYQGYMHDVDGDGKLQADLVWNLDAHGKPVCRVLSGHDVANAFGVGRPQGGWAKIDAVKNRDPTGDRIWQNDALWFQHALLHPSRQQGTDLDCVPLSIPSPSQPAISTQNSSRGCRRGPRS